MAFTITLLLIVVFAVIAGLAHSRRPADVVRIDEDDPTWSTDHDWQWPVPKYQVSIMLPPRADERIEFDVTMPSSEEQRLAAQDDPRGESDGLR